ncbi:hypothetical protein TVAG_271130 [Trichomonas vaginalis G3]|uniref:Uncharacterized protein n=1 Tax=Trichomonas vaginalis (strain ATCC PRA-98 / G3) TaxID=412133 RepID=A2EA82_TRIV3|nr:tissue development protein family [Trichomonas vaginalis G3]EAY10422.1 hypothetical protein TVAG_271130 [Trichomonas vaginalis G3]KAI5548328.1 tissue development protein family [Trichomonas vaginalis G3]|eukprot:XP_001322645.1 hypothetical protein [Trichomonas vaginalis G3]
MNLMYNELVKSKILVKTEGCYSFLNPFSSKRSVYTLTPLGEKVANFPFSSYISLAITTLSEQYGVDEKIAALLASLTMLIPNITITKLTSKLLIKNFERESDFATIVKSLFDVMINNGETIDPLDNQFTQKMISQIETFLKEIANKLGVNYEGIWIQLKAFYDRCDYINTFAQKLFKLISDNSIDGEWGRARTSSFSTISMFRNQFFASYNGNELVNFDKNDSYITISQRPGQVSLDFPSNAYIVNITRNTSLHRIDGSFIHINNGPNQGPHPQSIVIEQYLNNPFFTAVLQGYLGKEMKELIKINGSNGDASNYFYISEIDSEHCSFNFFPRNSDVADEVITAVNNLKCLAPYIGQTILIQHPTLKSCISLKAYGTDKYENQIIKYDDTKLHPYNINKNTISFLLKYIKEIPKFGYSKSIAFTGEDMIFSLDPNEPIEEDGGNISNPTTFYGCKSVFGMKSHLVILSDQLIPDEVELEWVGDHFNDKLQDQDSIRNKYVEMHVHKTAIAVLYSQNNNVEYIGQLARMNYFNIDHDQSKSPLVKIINKFELGCIKSNHLITEEVEQR